MSDTTSHLGEIYSAIVKTTEELAIFILDPEGKILSWNRGAELINGYSADEIIGQHFSALSTPEDIQNEKPALTLSKARTDGKYEEKGWQVRKDGSRLWAHVIIRPLHDSSGNFFGYYEITRDLTAQHRADEQLRLVVEAAPNGMIIVNRTGEILLANAQTKKLFGYDSSELLGKKVEMLIPERFRGKHPSHREGFFKDPHVRPMGAGRELFGVRKDGTEFPVEIGLNPMQTETGPAVLASIIDISERKKLEDERKRLYENEQALRTSAERANQIKDEFLATLSHELRTPLNAIIGWAQLMKRKKDDPIELDRGIAIIEKNARAQAQIISDLLDMNRILAGKLRLEIKEIDLNALIEIVVDSAYPIASSKNISIVANKGEAKILVKGDPDRLQQCLWNLMTNALKFTPAGGKVEIRTDQTSFGPRIEISDTGQGISPAFIPYVFDRFRQADSSDTRKTGGLGLGLSIVKSLVELHGGSITVESRGENCGSTFAINLPSQLPDCLAAKNSGEPGFVAAPQINQEDTDLSGLKVLVVDDEVDSREMVKALLEEFGAVVVTASSAQEGMALLKSSRPNIIIGDIGMPLRNGYDFIRDVRRLSSEEGGKTPAIALTAYARAEDRTQALLAGYQMHIAKPIEPSELVASVASMTR